MIHQIIISGLALGSCYSMVSVGMTILFQGTTILNFGHGECAMIGAFIFYTVKVLLGLSYPLAITITIVASFMVGMLMDLSVFRRIIFAPHVNLVLATCGFLYFFKGLARLIWGSEPKFPPPVINIPPIDLYGAIITSQDIAIFITALVLVILFIWVFLYSETGLKLRAAAQSLRGASLVGINTNRFFLIIWGTSIGIGAIAGVLLSPVFSIHPDLGDTILLRAFAAMTLGGFGNIGGAAIGGIIIGIVENLVSFYAWSPLREIVAYIIIVIVLIIKPTGILGVRKF